MPRKTDRDYYDSKEKAEIFDKMLRASPRLRDRHEEIWRRYQPQPIHD